MIDCSSTTRIGRRTYNTRQEAQQDMPECIEMFDDPVRKHVSNAMLSPLHFEQRQILHAQSV
ncbi:hypothetical protein [Komagataeibacter europaeus]|uniref:hypothetical protein n=1 Tax=Komagataeibacter europaeus TaxID=33995 RepID=UPI00128EBF27|nr:hypothetical protein [Komagataeibacter europaeus]